MNTRATRRLRLLLALYSGAIGYITFEAISLALDMVLPDQYFCYYGTLTTRTLIILFCFSAAGFSVLPHFFTPQVYKLRRAIIGGAASFVAALAALIVIFSQPQFARGFLLPEKHSLLSILLAKHGAYLVSPLTQGPVNTVNEDFVHLTIYFLVSFLVSASFGAILAWPLYRYSFNNNHGKAYWH